MSYTPQFEPAYEGGWKNKPYETTPIQASALNAYDTAIENIEDYLASDDSQENLADAYSDESTYSEGNYVIHGGVLYKCLEDIDEPEEWDSTKWESCLITDEMATSGGTTVVANPTGTATDTLNKLQVDETIYSVEGGGGNANIWTGTQEELEEVFDELEDGTQINITDDEQEVVEGGTIYSTDEQVIGLWTNNKPLYKRTISFTFSSTQNLGGNLYHDAQDLSSVIPNIDEVMPDVSNSYYEISNGIRGFIAILPEDARIDLYTTYQRTNVTAVVTLQYTKTTDSPLDLVVGKSTMYIASSDCYSTVEKEVGCWKDGKPLYQRVFDLGSDLAITQNAFTNTTIDASNMETLVDAKAIYSTGVTIYNVIANISNNIIRLQADRNDTNISARYIILQYTKTTDTAGSGQYTPASGKAIHYSTDEQVIGTWVDGSTVYQKIILHSGVIAGAQTATQIAHGISNLGRIIEAEATVYDDHSSPSWMSVPRIAYDANNIGFSGIDDTYINFYVPSAFQNRIKDAHFILKYTKSSS